MKTRYWLTTLDEKNYVGCMGALVVKGFEFEFKPGVGVIVHVTPFEQDKARFKEFAEVLRMFNVMCASPIVATVTIREP